jgi:hypothetical protein
MYQPVTGLSVNNPFKKQMKAEFTTWYSGLIKDSLGEGQELGFDSMWVSG